MKKRQNNQIFCRAAVEEVQYTERTKDCGKEHNATVSQLYRNLIKKKKDEGRARSGEADLFIPAFRKQRQEDHEEGERRVKEKQY